MPRPDEPPSEVVHGSARGTADRLRALQAKLGRARGIERTPRDRPLVASFGQEQLWLLEQLHPENVPYNQGTLYRLRGPLDVGALGRAFGQIERRHESLRTRLELEGGRVCQTIRAPGEFELPRTELVALPAAERLSAAESRAEDEIYRPFDLGSDGPLRPHLYRLSDDDHVLLLGTHHAGWDGWSLGVFWREIEALYRAERDAKPVELPTLAVQYADFSAWQRRELAGDKLERLVGFWRSHLADSAPLELPSDRPRPTQPTQSGASLNFALPPELLQALKELAGAHGTSLFTVLLSAFGALLGRLSGQEDFVIGTPVAGRSRPELEPLIGFFVNMLALRIDLRADPSFRELVERTKQALLEGFEHLELPFEELVASLRVPRDPARHPLFQVALVLHNMPPAEPRLQGLDVEKRSLGSARSRFDLTLTLLEERGELRGTFEYATELFERATVARWRGHFEALLRSALADPSLPLSRLALLSDAERHQLLVEWNATDREYPRQARVHELFEDVARRTPESVALIEDQRRMSYAELDRRANRLARRLRDLGVAPGTLVGVHLDRSIELVVTQLATLKAGAAYVPLDRSYPLERLRFLLEDTHAAVVVTQGPWPEELALLPPRVLDLAGQGAELAALSGDPLGTPGGALETAYVMYTSGSSGLPKGVSVPHRGIVRLVRGQSFVPFDAAQRFLLLSSPSFDLSTLEIWGPLLNGGVCVVFAERWPDLERLEQVIRDHDVNCLWLTAGLFNQIIGQRPSLLSTVHYVLAGGEALSVPHVQQALELLPSVRLIDGYGPTESTTFASTFAIEKGAVWPGGTVPIGRPIANTRCYVLDTRGEPTPIGVPGELYIGGDGVANGYFQRPELSAEKFVPDPFGPDPGARLYRSGDLCRWQADGNLEFLGRLDNQVKIRGHRVELGEIEALLSQHPDLAEAAVVACASTAGTKALAAFVVARAGLEPSFASVRAFLGLRLPDYMLPSSFEIVERLPLTANGKLDRRALAARVSLPQRTTGAGAPGSLLEAELLAIWRSVLEQDALGTQDDFFEHGGHSILAMRLLYEIEDKLGTKLGLRDLFSMRTVEKLAVRIAAEGGVRASPFQGATSGAPLFYVPGPAGFGFLPQAVAEHVGRVRPYYDGLSYPPLLWGRTGLASVEEIASVLVPQIRALCTGPCCVAGHSFGGVVAYEVARQLAALGQRVETLVLWDAVLRLERRELRALWELACNLATASSEERRTFFTKRLEYWTRRGQKLLARARLRTGAATPLDAGVEADDADLGNLAHDVYAEAYTLVGKYDPLPYTGRVVLFKAKRRTMRIMYVSAELNGWKEVFRGPLEVHEVAGDHLDLVRAPLVAEATAACLVAGSEPA